jgi:uncharacterized protein (DUF2132 family)
MTLAIFLSSLYFSSSILFIRKTSNSTTNKVQTKYIERRKRKKKQPGLPRAAIHPIFS